MSFLRQSERDNFTRQITGRGYETMHLERPKNERIVPPTDKKELIKIVQDGDYFAVTKAWSKALSRGMSLPDFDPKLNLVYESYTILSDMADAQSIKEALTLERALREFYGLSERLNTDTHYLMKRRILIAKAEEEPFPARLFLKALKFKNVNFSDAYRDFENSRVINRDDFNTARMVIDKYYTNLFSEAELMLFMTRQEAAELRTQKDGKKSVMAKRRLKINDNGREEINELTDRIKLLSKKKPTRKDVAVILGGSDTEDKKADTKDIRMIDNIMQEADDIVEATEEQSQTEEPSESLQEITEDPYTISESEQTELTEATEYDPKEDKNGFCFSAQTRGKLRFRAKVYIDALGKQFPEVQNMTEVERNIFLAMIKDAWRCRYISSKGVKCFSTARYGDAPDYRCPKHRDLQSAV